MRREILRFYSGRDVEVKIILEKNGREVFLLGPIQTHPKILGNVFIK